MRRFLKDLAIFSIPVLLILFSGLVLPPTPRASKSSIAGLVKKDSLLINVTSPRVILVGGSNMSLGLNSFKIKEQLDLNPINMGTDINVGIKYMLENTLPYVQARDVIILGFEYDHFFRPYEYTSNVLLRVFTDVFPEKINLLSFSQKLRLLQFIPKFSLSKFNPSEYRNVQEDKLYGPSGFNQFGDVHAHWDIEKSSYKPMTTRGKVHIDVIEKIQEFEKSAVKKGARVFLTFPAFDEVSFSNSKQKVLQIEELFEKYGFDILGSAERYVMPKNLMFDSPYHLNKTGLERRTQQLIEDYQNF